MWIDRESRSSVLCFRSSAGRRRPARRALAIRRRVGAQTFGARGSMSLPGPGYTLLPVHFNL